MDCPEKGLVLSRRAFIRSGVLASVMVGSGTAVACATGPSVASKPRARAKNVIFMVSDGMSSGTLTTADQYLMWRDGRRSNWLKLYDDRVGSRSLMETASADSIVTDSSAASSAWGCGRRVQNGVLNMDADGRPLEPIFLLAKAAGKSTGVVVTVPVTHATPAGFGANHLDRSKEADIALQYYEREFDVMLGGGQRFFSAADRADGRDLYAEFERKGYAVVRDAAALKAVARSKHKILGTFAPGAHPYEIDRLNTPDFRETVPSLADMARDALDRLSQNEEGFIVQIEGGRVDHAAHANDIGALIFDQIGFDEAIEVARQFQEENPDTLLIVTTDHGNANPGLLCGQDGGEKTFSKLSQFQSRLASLRLHKDMSLSDIQERFAVVTRLDLSRNHAQLLQLTLRGDYHVPFSRMNSLRGIVAQVVADYLDFGWIGDGHTGDHVELFAMGPGSERLAQFTKNYELFHLMVEAMGLPKSLAKR